jgi:branched-chain amino acid transport system permease protein
MNADLAFYLQQGLNVLQLGAFYLPLALAFALIQAITRRIFLSAGDLAMFASFAAIYVAFDQMLDGGTDWRVYFVSLLGAIVCGGALGFAVSRFVLGEKLLASPLAFMIASLGLAIALQELMRLQSSARDIWLPPLFGGDYTFFVEGEFPLRLSMMTAMAVAASLVAAGAVALLLTQTGFGRQWRAVAQAPKLAKLCGVNGLAVASITFALAGALAGVSGWTSSISYGGANFSTGMMIGFKAMFAAVIGGFGSLRGAALGAFLLAGAEVLWSVQFSTAYRDVAIFGLITLALVLKPEGILGDATAWHDD